MERGYYVIIAGAAIFVLGIVLTTVWALPIAEQLQNETRILQQVDILAANSLNIEFIVTDPEKPLSVIITPNEAAAMKATVTDPEGEEILSSEFTEAFANSAESTTAGTYMLVIENEDTEDATVDIVFGHIPGVGEDAVNAGTYSGVIAGVGIITAGVMVMVGGVVVWVSDRRKKNREIQKGDQERQSG